MLLLLLVWELAARAVGQEIIIPYPGSTLRELRILFISPGFWADMGSTVLRGGAGFLISLAGGLAVGTLAGAVPRFRYFFAPVLSVVRTTPLMSIILLALIWFTSNYVPVFVAVLTAFPVITDNVVEGFLNVDANLVDMARSYGLDRGRRLRHVYLPSLYPYVLAGASSSLGLTWKVVIAAEVLSRPIHALGTGLADAKMDIDTAEVFAWTIVAILLSGLSEFTFRTVLRRLRRRG